VTLRVVLHVAADRGSPLVQVSRLLMADPDDGWPAAGAVRSDAVSLARIVQGFLRRTTVDSLSVTAGVGRLEVTVGTRATTEQPALT
jgi:hypothetical protein